MRVHAVLYTVVLCLGLALADATASGAVWIITPDEAAQPEARQIVVDRSDPDGPRVTVRMPGDVQSVPSPVSIDVAFEPKADAAIDVDSLKITYLRLFNIDITDRLRPYVSRAGIRATNAKLAVGRHHVEILVKDTAGRTTVERFRFTVAGPKT